MEKLTEADLTDQGVKALLDGARPDDIVQRLQGDPRFTPEVRGNLRLASRLYKLPLLESGPEAFADGRKQMLKALAEKLVSSSRL